MRGDCYTDNMDIKKKLTSKLFKTLTGVYKTEKAKLMLNNPTCFLSGKIIESSEQALCKQVNPTFIHLVNQFIEQVSPQENQDFTIQTTIGHEKLNNLKVLKEPKITLNSEFKQQFIDFFQMNHNLVLIDKAEYNQTL